MRDLIVVRHGETQFNVEKRYTGSLDIELNNTGVNQAQNIAEELNKYFIDIIITSPLKRAKQTTEIINSELQLPIIEMKEFRERKVGVFEGLTREEAKYKYPNLWKQNITRIYNAAPDEGETIREVEERVIKGIDKLQNCQFKGKNILLVTHAFIFKVINKNFNKLSEGDFYDISFKNCHICKYSIE